MAKELEADYCIVGAGIAGLLVATKLAKAGHEVLVIDQGPDIGEQQRAALLAQARRELNYGVDYNDHLDAAVLTPTAGAQAGRLFGTGGTALHFAGWMVRPVTEDMQVKTLFGYGRDWPISYQQLEPWLLAAELETGVAGNEDNPYAEARSKPFPMQGHAFSYFDREIFAPALAKLGMTGHSTPFAVASRAYEQDYGMRSECLGCRYCQFCPTGARYSPDRVHGAWLKTLPNATIRNGLSLRRLETSPDGTRIVAAHARTVDGHDEVIIKAKHFVLAMGGVATARALLLSSDNANHAQGLGNSEGQVGFGFTDHLFPGAYMQLDRHAGGMLGYLTMQSDHGRKHAKRDEEPSWILLGPPVAPSASIQAVPWALHDDRLSLAELRSALPRTVDIWMMSELSGSGTLSLDSKRKDAFGDPLAHIDLPFNDRDLSVNQRFAKLMADLGEQMGAANLSVGEATCNHNHPSGATAMSTSPDHGVCDEDLRVFGIKNLHLCSSSVFPHLAASPPTLTIAALALRLGSHLVKKS